MPVGCGQWTITERHHPCGTFPLGKPGSPAPCLWLAALLVPPTLHNLCCLAPSAATVGTRLACRGLGNGIHADPTVLSHLPALSPDAGASFHTITGVE